MQRGPERRPDPGDGEEGSTEEEIELWIFHGGRGIGQIYAEMAVNFYDPPFQAQMPRLYSSTMKRYRR